MNLHDLQSSQLFDFEPDGSSVDPQGGIIVHLGPPPEPSPPEFGPSDRSDHGEVTPPRSRRSYLSAPPSPDTTTSAQTPPQQLSPPPSPARVDPMHASGPGDAQALRLDSPPADTWGGLGDLGLDLGAWADEQAVESSVEEELAPRPPVGAKPVSMRASKRVAEAKLKAEADKKAEEEDKAVEASRAAAKKLAEAQATNAAAAKEKEAKEAAVAAKGAARKERQPISPARVRPKRVHSPVDYPAEWKNSEVRQQIFAKEQGRLLHTLDSRTPVAIARVQARLDSPSPQPLPPIPSAAEAELSAETLAITRVVTRVNAADTAGKGGGFWTYTRPTHDAPMVMFVRSFGSTRLMGERGSFAGPGGLASCSRCGSIRGASQSRSGGTTTARAVTWTTTCCRRPTRSSTRTTSSS